MDGQNFYVHPTADVSPEAIVGEGTSIWQHCQVRKGAVIGQNCILSKGVYIEPACHLGSNVKVQNGISIYQGVTLEDGVFCGPHCVFTNDRQPRAINPDGTLKKADDWQVSETLVRHGASIGAQRHDRLRRHGRPLGDDRCGSSGDPRCAGLRAGLR